MPVSKSVDRMDCYEKENLQMDMKKKKRIEVRDVVFWIPILVLTMISLMALWQIGSYFQDEWKSRNFSRELQKSVILVDDQNRENDDAVSEPVNESAEEMSEIPKGVDFESLQEISEDVVAWLYAPDTAIDDIVVQAKDNDYYLRRLPDGTRANAGTLFVDCRNSAGFSDWNTIIYGHNMKNGTRFASLLNYSDSKYYEEHPVMYLYIQEHCYKLELIAGYTTDVNDLIYSLPTAESERKEILNHAYQESDFKSGITVQEEDRLVTLSTCSYAYEDARYVVIGRLVEE